MFNIFLLLHESFNNIKFLCVYLHFLSRYSFKNFSWIFSWILNIKIILRHNPWFGIICSVLGETERKTKTMKRIFFFFLVSHDHILTQIGFKIKENELFHKTNSPDPSLEKADAHSYSQEFIFPQVSARIVFVLTCLSDSGGF